MNHYKAIVFCIFAPFVYAEDIPNEKIKAEVLRISKIENDAVLRQELTDLARALDSKAISRETGDWSVNTEKSPIDDSKTVVLALRASSPVHAWPNETVTPSLVIRFKEGKLESYFSLGVMPQTESGNSRSFTLRFNSNPAKDYKGSLSTDGKGVFIKETRLLLREIASADKLTLRFTPFNSTPVITTFNLKGFTNASQELLSVAKLDLKDRNIQFEDAYRNELSKQSLYSAYGISVERNSIRIDVEGGRWKPFARDSGAVDLISTALNALKGIPKDSKFKLVVTINGSSVREPRDSDSAVPFTSQELNQLFNKAIEKTKFDRKLISNTKINTVTPSYYGKGEPEILAGRLKSTNELINITVELL